MRSTPLLLGFALLTLAACGMPTQTDGGTTDSGIPDAGSGDAGGLDPGGTCGTLKNTAPPVVSACPPDTQCADCTGSALQDGLYFETGTEIYASGCGALASVGTLTIKTGTIEWIQSTPVNFDPNSAYTTTRSVSTYTTTGSTLHLATSCDEPDGGGGGDGVDYTYGTNGDGGLMLTTPGSGSMSIVTTFQRQ